MSNNTFTLKNIDKVNFYGTDSDADVYLEGVSTGGTSGVCVSGSLLVNGDYMNFGTSLGTSGHGFRSSDSGGSIQFKHFGGEWTTLSSGGSAAGSNTEIQFNDNGSFGTCTGFTFDNSNNELILVNGNIKVDNGGGFCTVEINNKDSANGNDSSIRLGSVNSINNDKNIEIISDISGTGGPRIKLRDENSAAVYTTAELTGSSSSEVGGLYGGKLVLGSTGDGGSPSQKDIFRIDAPNQRIVMLDRDSGVSVNFGVSTSITQNSNFFLPDGNGTTGYVLSADGQGGTSWVAQNGGGSGSPSGPGNSVQFNSSSAFAGTSSLQFFEASSTTGGVSALTVDGNVFSRGLSVVESNESSGSVYNIPVENFVNGVVFPPYGTTGNEEHHVVKVPTLSHINTSYSDVLKDGQFFETLIYGTSTGVSNGLSIPADITVLSNTDVIFDTRLIKNRTPAYTGTGMSFHGATRWNGETYQGVVIKSRYTSTGVSMYPASTAFYN